MKKLFVMIATATLMVACGQEKTSSTDCDSTKVCCKDSTTVSDSTKVVTDSTSTDTVKVGE